jgi:hypothetical protein
MPPFQSRTRALLFGATLLALPACNNFSEPLAEDGGVEFNYAGTVSGRFRAVGPASQAHDPSRSFAVAFRSASGELQLCAYEATGRGSGNFLLLNAGAAVVAGEYGVPPGPASGARTYQPGTFLLGVDASRSGIEKISTFVEGHVHVDELSARRARGTFSVTTLLTTLAEGRFDVTFAEPVDLPIMCE